MLFIARTPAAAKRSPISPSIATAGRLRTSEWQPEKNLAQQCFLLQGRPRQRRDLQSRPCIPSTNARDSLLSFGKDYFFFKSLPKSPPSTLPVLEPELEAPPSNEPSTSPILPAPLLLPKIDSRYGAIEAKMPET